MKATRKIPLFKPTTGYEESSAVAEVLASGWLGNGPQCRLFEEEFAEFIGVKHAIATNSGTAALHLAAHALGINRQSTVVVPAITFCSTAHAAAYMGAHIVCCDIDPNTLNMCPMALQAIMNRWAVTHVIVVHYGGRPCEVGSLSAVTRPGVKVIEDCAERIGPGVPYEIPIFFLTDGIVGPNVPKAEGKFIKEGCDIQTLHHPPLRISTTLPAASSDSTIAAQRSSTRARCGSISERL